MSDLAPYGEVVPLVTAEQKDMAAKAEEAIWALDAPFIRFVSVTPLAQPDGTCIELFIGTDGTHTDRAVMDVVNLLLAQECPELPAVVHARRGRVR